MYSEGKILHALAQMHADNQAQFAKIDARFDAIDTRLDKVDARLDKVETRLDKVDARLDKMDDRFDKVESRLDKIDDRLDKMDVRLDKMDDRLDKMDARLDKMDDRFDKVEARLDTIELLQADMAHTLDAVFEHTIMLTEWKTVSEESVKECRILCRQNTIDIIKLRAAVSK